ncbi:MAG TPA: hypothetical protein VKA74_05660, partial [Myxococcota bacterium]|nr:hypothetical protein [Myxococcota bacterium]
QESLPDSEALGGRIDALVEERLTASQARLEAMVSAAEARAEAAERRARDAVALSEEHAARLGALAGEVDAKLVTLDERIESARSIGMETGEELRRRGEKVREQLEQSLTEVLGKARDAGEALSTQIDDALTQSERRVAELDKSIEPVLEASVRAMRALGMDPENPVFEDSPLARIESLVDRGETQLASLDRVYRQLEDLQSQAESVRSAFGNWLLEAAGELDKLESRKDAVVGPMSEAGRLIRDLGPEVEDKLELASTKLTHLQSEQAALRTTIEASSTLAEDVRERMSNQSGQLQALLDGSLHKLSTRVEQAGVWLGALIQRAESLGSAIPGAGTMQFEQSASRTQAPAPAQSPAQSPPEAPPEPPT